MYIARLRKSKYITSPRCPGPTHIGTRRPIRRVSPSYSCMATKFIARHYQSTAARTYGAHTHTPASGYRIEDPDIIFQFLTRKGISYRIGDANSDHIRIRVCPFCHDVKDKPDNMYRLYVYRSTGQFHCFRCGAHGSWADFQKRLSENADVTPAPRRVPQRAAPQRTSPAAPRQAIDFYEGRMGPAARTAPPTTRNLSNMSSGGDKTKVPDPGKLEKHIANLQQITEAKDYLYKVRQLNEDVVRKYKVGACLLRVKQKTPDGNEQFVDHICISFPWIDSSNNVIRIKTRSITDKSLQRLDPVGGSWGLFGFHLITPETKNIIITEGEFDAMAVYQATGIPAVSLPAGANCFPPEIVQMLERFERIYLWLDDDIPGQEGAKKFANKLGRERCWIVQTRGGSEEGPKDANDALRQGMDLKAILAAAKPIPHKELLSFHELKTEVYRELANPDQVAGYKSMFFPTLTKILKGFRKGELTVLTGPTGIGKTTLLSQLSLDFMLQGVKTLWGSFEINNVRLAKKIISQFAQMNLDNNVEEFDAIADQFDELPLYFLRFQGSADLDEVLDAMEYAVYVYDVEHIILDNLQFMMSNAMLSRGGYDKFDQLDLAIAKLRKFATTRNVHISLIIHPRKEDDGKALGTSSVFGTAKATQEADNVVIIQKGKYYRYLEVVKNRFSGDLGCVPYRFIPEGNRYVEMTPEQVAEAEGRRLPRQKKSSKRNNEGEQEHEGEGEGEGVEESEREVNV